MQELEFIISSARDLRGRIITQIAVICITYAYLQGEEYCQIETCDSVVLYNKNH